MKSAKELIRLDSTHYVIFKVIFLMISAKELIRLDIHMISAKELIRLDSTHNIQKRTY